MIIAEYIWLDANYNFRSKARTLTKDSDELENYPDWNYDGSSTGQAEGHNSEIILKPCAVFRCPFRRGDHRMVWCDTYYPSGMHTKTNTRCEANLIFAGKPEEEPWFGIEQEYFMYAYPSNSQKPLGFPLHGYPEKQGKYYCGVGSGAVFGRKLADTHYEYCLYSGIQISGINAEVAPGQWEFQIGPCEGIQSGDHVWMARYVLKRLAEEFDIVIDFHPKPVEGDWNGSGCHTNYSTHNMRNGTKEITGLGFIKEAISKLEIAHSEHMSVYGDYNNLRMTGEHETSDYNSFSSGVGSRCASVRIPSTTQKDGKGYFEDRRPSSNCDPYLVTSKLFHTTCLK